MQVLSIEEIQRWAVAEIAYSRLLMREETAGHTFELVCY